jgi:hypothetical protein
MTLSFYAPDLFLSNTINAKKPRQQLFFCAAAQPAILPVFVPADYFVSTIIASSTAALSGSSAAPIAVRAC